MDSSCGAAFPIFPDWPVFDGLPFLTDDLGVLLSTAGVVAMKESGFRARKAHISDRFANYLTNGFQKRISEIRRAENSRYD